MKTITYNNKEYTTSAAHNSQASKLQVQNIQLPVTIRGINLKNLILQTVDIAEIAM